MASVFWLHCSCCWVGVGHGNGIGIGWFAVMLRSSMRYCSRVAREEFGSVLMVDFWDFGAVFAIL